MSFIGLIKNAAILAAFLGGVIGNLAWADSAPAPIETRECNQACLYKKANEHLSLQALYIVKKIDALKNAKFDERIEALEHFCMKDERTQGVRGSKECFDRYQRLQLIQINKIQSAMTQNYETIASLRSKRGTEAAPLEDVPALTIGEDLSKLKSQTPEVQSLSQLQSKILEDSSKSDFAQITQAEYNDWLNGFHAKSAPAREDFVLFREVRRDPMDPKSEMLKIVDRRCGKEVCYDEKAFAAATKVFAAQQESIQGDILKMSGQETLLRGIVLKKGKEYNESAKLYAYARGVVIQAANEKIEETKKKNGVRNPAAQETKKISEGVYTQEFSGEEKLKEMPVGESSPDIYVSWSPEAIRAKASGLAQEK